MYKTMNLEDLATRAGMTSHLDMGAASCVCSDGCNGVTAEHMLRFMSLVISEHEGPGRTERHFAYEFEVWQGDEMQASTSGPRDTALREAMHYAAQYAQDGPVRVFEVTRTPVSPRVRSNTWLGRWLRNERTQAWERAE